MPSCVVQVGGVIRGSMTEPGSVLDSNIKLFKAAEKDYLERQRRASAPGSGAGGAGGARAGGSGSGSGPSSLEDPAAAVPDLDRQRAFCTHRMLKAYVGAQIALCARALEALSEAHAALQLVDPDRDAERFACEPTLPSCFTTLWLTRLLPCRGGRSTGRPGHYRVMQRVRGCGRRGVSRELQTNNNPIFPNHVHASTPPDPSDFRSSMGGACAVCCNGKREARQIARPGTV